MLTLLLIMIQISITGTGLRDNEVHNSLNAATDYAMDMVEDLYTSRQKDSLEDEEAFLDQMMKKFCTALHEMIGSDGEITVRLLAADLQNGLFDISVREEYRYPVKQKKGVCYCEKAFAMNTP